MNITKKLMIAAGLFFQLSNLQADMSQSMQDAIGKFDAAKVSKGSDLGLIKIKNAAQSIGTPEADAYGAYLAQSKGKVSSSQIKGMFPKADQISADDKDALDSMFGKKSVVRVAPQEQEEAPGQQQEQSAPGQSSADSAELAAAKAQAADSDAKAQAAVEKAKAAEKAKNEAEQAKRNLEAKLRELQAKAAAGDADLVAIQQEILNAKMDPVKLKAAYIKLAQKSAQSLKDAINSIIDSAIRAEVMDAVQAAMNPQASSGAASKHNRNLGRLGSKKNKKKLKA